MKIKLTVLCSQPCLVRRDPYNNNNMITLLKSIALENHYNPTCVACQLVSYFCSKEILTYVLFIGGWASA